MQVLSILALLFSSMGSQAPVTKTYTSWPSGARYLIIAYDDFVPQAESLARWKTKKGMLAKVYSLSQVGGTSSQIRNFVVNAYNTWDPRPEYLLLFGGAQQIPYGYDYASSDCYYTNMDSDLPDEIIPGRLPATNSTEAWTMVAKTINYEENPFLSDTTWFLKATNIIREDGDSDDTLYWGDALHAETLMVQVGYTHVDTFSYFQGAGWSDVRNAVNSGRSFVHFRGQSTHTWWSPFHPNFSELSNGWKLPIVATFTCSQIDPGSSSYQEQWVRIGSPEDPRGAVGVCGPTTVVTGDAIARSAMSRGFFGYVFHLSLGGIAHFGDGVENGRITEWQEVGQIGEGKGLTCIGDPELNLWTGVPHSLAVTYPQQIPPDTSNFTVDVSKDGNPLENALVCVMKTNSIYAYGYTDDMGEVTLELPAGEAGDTLNITVTGRNAIPYEGFTVVSPSGVGYTNYWIVDTPDGNNDSIPNPGESPYLGMTIKNYGITEETGIVAYLHSSDSFLTMIDTVENFGDLSPGDSATSSNAFKFSISPSTPDGHNLGLTLEIRDEDLNTWIYTLTGLNVVGANVTLQITDIKDTLPGCDNDGLLDPGERAYFSFMAKNTGGMAISSVEITFIPQSGARPLEYDEVTLPVGNLNPGDSALLGTSLLVRAPRFINPGTAKSILFSASGTCETYGYNRTEFYPVAVGDIRKLATGPDAYGYFAYDIKDDYTLKNPEYSWFEIAPPGPGQIISEITNEDADTVTLSLPFTFKFYGINYNSIGVCSNGFLEMDHSTYRFGDNTNIPHVGGPKRLIAPFWDDLDPAEGGDIYQYHDSANHRWIVEFKDCVHYGDGNPETFQVILFDPQYDSTATGDGEILFLYKTVSNASSCTIGIEDQTETIGIQYLYNDDYDPMAHPLENSFAILFSTDPPGTKWPIPAARESFTGSEDSSKTLKTEEKGNHYITELKGVVPNPVISYGEVQFSLKNNSEVTISLYDLQGRMVTNLTKGKYSEGNHSLALKNLKIPQGVYFIRMETKNYTKTIPFVFMP